MKIIYYYHMPKCGGTLVNKQLKDLSASLGAEYHNFNTDMKKYGKVRKLYNDYKLRRFFKSINEKTCEFKFIHHHHGFYGISEIEDLLIQAKKEANSLGNEFYLFTSIRDPISFQISRINYLRNSCGLEHLSFEDSCKDAKHHNVLYKYFMYNHPARWSSREVKDEDFKNSLALVDKIFTLEQLDELYSWLENIVGLPVSSPKRKENVGTHSLLPSESQLKTLQDVNKFDQYFYDFAKVKEEP